MNSTEESSNLTELDMLLVGVPFQAAVVIRSVVNPGTPLSIKVEQLIKIFQLRDQVIADQSKAAVLEVLERIEKAFQTVDWAYDDSTEFDNEIKAIRQELAGEAVREEE